MGRIAMAFAMAFLVGCGGGADDTDDTEELGGQGGACGAVTEHNLSIVGQVTQGGQPVEGAEVWIEERLWTVDERFGSGTTNASGTFQFDAPRVVSVEDCWGTALDYVIVAVRGDDIAEDDMNSSLFEAISNGSNAVDISTFPLEL